MPARSDFEERLAHYERLWVKAYDAGTPRNLPMTEDTLKSLMIRNREEYGDDVHIIAGSKTWTWRESDEIACKVANAFLSLGVRKGDRVTLVLRNRPAVVVGRMACFKMGAVSIGLNPRCSIGEMYRNIKDSGTRIAVVDYDAAEKLEEVRLMADSPLERIMVVGQPEGIRTHLEFLDYMEEFPPTEPDVEVFPDDLQILSYTGGTTGVSKGCCYTNRMLVWHARAWETWFRPRLGDERIRMLVSLPMYHAYATTCSVALPIVAAGTVIVGTSPKIDDILSDINRFAPNVWPSIPAWVMPVAARSDARDSRLSDVAITLCGTCPVSEEALRQFNAATDSLMIEGYGLSECTSAVTFSPMSWQKINCVGVPICNTQVLTVDVEAGEKLTSLGEPGEIIVRGPQAIREYWNRPEATEKAIRDGWLYTGDIGFIDNDGFLHITGRKKEMLIVGGFNVFPREIDHVIENHPSVAQSCTVSAPHRRLGEVAYSFVVPAEGSKVDLDELEAYCRREMVAYKVPKGFTVLDSIPLTPMNKPDVQLLKARAAELFAGGE